MSEPEPADAVETQVDLNQEDNNEVEGSDEDVKPVRRESGHGLLSRMQSSRLSILGGFGSEMFSGDSKENNTRILEMDVRMQDLVFLVEAMWKRIKDTRLREMSTRKELSDLDALQLLEKSNRRIQVLLEKVDDCKCLYDKSEDCESSLLSLLPFSSGITSLLLDNSAMRMSKEDIKTLTSRAASVFFEMATHVLEQRKEVNGYMEALLSPVVQKVRDAELAAEREEENEEEEEVLASNSPELTELTRFVMDAEQEDGENEPTEIEPPTRNETFGILDDISDADSMEEPDIVEL